MFKTLKKIKNLLIRLIKPICKRNFINDLPKNSLVLDLGVDNNSQNFFFSLRPDCRYYGLDITKELESILSEELAKSIDREIIDGIIQAGIRSKLDSLLKKIIRRDKLDSLLDD